MDLILKRTVIPKSTNDCYIIYPRSRTFVTGLAKEYECKYNRRILGQYISKTDYEFMIQSFNDGLITFWPCPLSESLGYIFCPVTCGLSFCLPNICIRDAEKAFRVKIDYFNQYKLK